MAVIEKSNLFEKESERNERTQTCRLTDAHRDKENPTTDEGASIWIWPLSKWKRTLKTRTCGSTFKSITEKSFGRQSTKVWQGNEEERQGQPRITEEGGESRRAPLLRRQWKCRPISNEGDDTASMQKDDVSKESEAESWNEVLHKTLNGKCWETKVTRPSRRFAKPNDVIQD